MIGLIFLAVFSYTIAASVICNLLIHLDIGVTHYNLLEDDFMGAVMLSVIWPITGLVLVSFAIGTSIFSFIMNKKEK